MSSRIAIASTVIAMLFTAATAARAAEVIEWRNTTGTWEVFTTVAGDWERIAAKENDDYLFLSDGSGVHYYARGFGGSTSPHFGPTGEVVTLPGITDVTTDDSAGSERVQIVHGGSVDEYVEDPASFETDFGSGNIITAEQVNQQESLLGIDSSGNIAYFIRGSDTATPLTYENGTPGGNFIDITIRSQHPTGRVFALTDTGFEEWAFDGVDTMYFEQSFAGIFADATGVSVDGDQDILYVSTLHGLLRFDRAGPTMTIIDDTRGYLDVDVPRGDARTGNNAIVWAVVAPTATVIPAPGALPAGLALLGLIAARRRRAA